jgi:NADH dehydrogenase
MQRILILGGGFGGVYTALYLEKYLRKAISKKEIEIALVNRDNYFVYQPMLSEVVGGSVGLFDTVSPIRRLLLRTSLYVREIEKIDLESSEVVLVPQFSHTPTILKYDHLILALGNVTDFRDNPGLHEHALAFKNLADALVIRNRVIEAIAAAAVVKDPYFRKQLLTFVIGGGGFSGTEVCAEVNDFARKLCKEYPQIDPDEIRVVLVHSKDRVLDSELPESLGRYAGDVLRKRGVEIHFNQRLLSATPEEAILDDKSRIPSKTIISSVPSYPNPLIQSLDLPKTKERIRTNPFMQVEGKENIWALGDCAIIPVIKNNTFSPPTAQFAIREAKQLAKNLAAHLENKPKKPFYFKALGLLGALGHHSAVAELFGLFKFSGFFAWLLWRFIYWIKLPGLDRKIKTAASWFLDLIIPADAVELKIAPSQGISRFHFEPDDIIFNEGDSGDYLYIILSGEVEVFNKKSGHIANLKQGEYFGEMALLNQKSRFATVKCIKSTDLLGLRKQDFGTLIANFSQLKENFEETEKKRRSLGT